MLAAPLTSSEAQRIVAAPDRGEADTALDADRMPARTLAFMQLEEGDRVLDVFAGGGYYAEMIARAVGPAGRVLAHNPTAFSKRDNIRAATMQRGYGEARLPNVSALNRDFMSLYLAPNSIDAALFHLVYHDLYFTSAQYGLPRTEPQTVLAELNRALRPGGQVTIIDHTGSGEDPRAEVEAVHRIDPARVVEDMRQAGFEIVAYETFFENPDDNPSINVFDPAVRGKTDRFAMRFAKTGDPNVRFPAEPIMIADATSSPGGDLCAPAAAANFVGQRFDDSLRAAILAATGAATARAYEDGDMVTMDYREDRVNIVLDGDTGLVTDVKCG